MKIIKVIAASIILFSFSNVSFATSKVQECVSQYGDYSNNDYDINTTACNRTAQWQRLGTKWNADTDGHKDSQTETNTATDDGVSWETLVDGNWVENGDLIQGGSVRFIFDVTRSIVGNHKYDQLKSWVDWNQDGSWDESETIIAEKWMKNENSEGVVQTWDWDNQFFKDNVVKNWENDDVTDWNGRDGTLNQDLYRNGYSNYANSLDTTATFTSKILSIPAKFDELWLRARVVCENSLENLSDDMTLLSYGYQDQGEVEDYKFKVAKVEVPEPSTLLILSLGLFALANSRKKTQQQ